MEKEELTFNTEQITFMKEVGINPTNLDEVFDVVDLMLRKRGFDKNYNPTSIGLMCESILDTLVDMGY